MKKATNEETLDGQRESNRLTTERLKILVACEYSGAVRREFRALGHDAWSCDILPAEDGSPFHIEGDLIKVLEEPQFDCWTGESSPWDVGIFFPPCTDLAVSGARWFKEKQADGRQQRSIDFFMQCVNCGFPKWAIENPVGIMSTRYRKPDQVLQPYQYGHGETKATCLWLKGLPKLEPTNIVDGREARIHRMAPGPDRAKERSRTYEGIAKAMAAQWSK